MGDALAIPGMTMERGDHVCGFYYGDDERDALLLPFLRGALAGGDKCVAVVDAEPPAPERVGVDLEAARACGQLELYDVPQTYLRSGAFDPEEMIEFWESRARAAGADGRYDTAWVVGEMSWMDRADPGRDRLLRYETWANAFAAAFPQAVLCLYDLRRVGSGILMDLLRTHPRILLGGLLLENPHYLSGDELSTAHA